MVHAFIIEVGEVDFTGFFGSFVKYFFSWSGGARTCIDTAFFVIGLWIGFEVDGFEEVDNVFNEWDLLGFDSDALFAVHLKNLLFRWLVFKFTNTIIGLVQK